VSVQYVERIAHFAPVGVRLVDTVTGRPVSEDVSVLVVPPPPAPATTAFRTPSGVFAAHGLRSLRAWELRDVGPDGLPLPAADPALPFRVEVRDGSGRFHSFAVDRVLLPSGGLLAPACGSPPGSPPDAAAPALPLFSLPSRPIPPGMAVVRARLQHHGERSPAAYAALEVVPAPGAAPVRGIADERGEVAVLFGYPEPPGLAGSPPAGTKRPLAATSWPVTVRAFLPRAASPPEAGELPELCSLLDQSPTTLTTTESPPRELGEATLEYGRELVLRSSPGDAALLVGA
jgi:hypothetical protein